MDILSKLNDDQRNLLKHYVKPSMPFGPAQADIVEDPLIQWILFNQNNGLCSAYRQDPNLIIGRKGSGKTSMLQNTKKIDEHDFVVKIDTAELLDYTRSIVFPDGNFKNVMVETTARIWEMLIDTILMSEVATNTRLVLPKTRAFLASSSLPVGGFSKGVLRALREVANQNANSTGGMILGALFNLYDSQTSKYPDAILEIKNYLNCNKKNAVVIFDTVEEYFFNDEIWKSLYKGLLKCAGKYGDARRQIRLCIPAEYYYEFEAISTNIAKDFGKNMILQWLPSELYSIIAWRYLIFCHLYDPSKSALFPNLRMTDGDVVRSVVTSFLGRMVKNGSGFEESLLNYVLRHTQLLPRQMILILNGIFGQEDNFIKDWSDISDAEIVTKIKSVEHSISKQLSSSFQEKYPVISKMCSSVIVNLPRIFSDGDLRIAFNHFGKKHADVVQMEYDDFKIMMVEVGVIGRVYNVEDLIASAEFEYALPGRLHLNPDETLCLHPIFSGRYPCAVEKNAGKPFIYPMRDWSDSYGGRKLSYIAE
jgi:hypothetical protein